jgi:hypothetical protein
MTEAVKISITIAPPPAFPSSTTALPFPLISSISLPLLPLPPTSATTTSVTLLSVHQEHLQSLEVALGLARDELNERLTKFIQVVGPYEKVKGVTIEEDDEEDEDEDE